MSTRTAFAKAPAALLGLLLGALPYAGAAEPRPVPLATGLKNPTSVAVGADGKVYVTVAGELGKDGDGAVVLLDKGKAVPFATGLDDPRGLVAFGDALFVADKQRVWRVDRKGSARPFATFPAPPQALGDLAVDVESGTLFVGDAGDGKGHGGAVYRVTPKGKVDVVTDARRWPELHTPGGLALDGASHLLMADRGTGTLYRIKLVDGSTEKLADGLGSAGGLAWDRFGRLFVGDEKGGQIFVISRPGEKPVALTSGLAPADLCLAANGKAVLAADTKAGTVSAVRTTAPGAEVDETPLPVETALAFPNLEWSGWKGESDRGAVQALRPIVLTHAGDGSNRVFVATEQGVIHVFPDDQKATKTQVFLDIQNRVRYDDNSNEEGFLGLAFHPRYKQNGEFYVFYTPKKGAHPHTNVLSRFRVRRDDPSKADPASEEVLLTVTHNYWNHDGGTVAFGPDGFLYLTLGDGGSANDPDENGQNLKTLLGKMLRLDVDRKDGDKPYAIPKDNPFVGRKDVRPEIWAYGLRNVWRFAFDRKTGACWAADVGQNLYEEINLLVAGGNYGWSVREALHPFGAKGVGVKKDLIDPIWEYHHDVGKSITGGGVYRGKLLPELDGAYLYGDYVSGLFWALKYDEAKRRVVANRPIKSKAIPVMSFGEDEKGEVYFMTYSTTGQGLYRFVRSGERKGE